MSYCHLSELNHIVSLRKALSPWFCPLNALCVLSIKKNLILKKDDLWRGLNTHKFFFVCNMFTMYCVTFIAHIKITIRLLYCLIKALLNEKL